MARTWKVLPNSAAPVYALYTDTHTHTHAHTHTHTHTHTCRSWRKDCNAHVQDPHAQWGTNVGDGVVLLYLAK